jgi:hypothetical protein
MMGERPVRGSFGARAALCAAALAAAFSISHGREAAAEQILFDSFENGPNDGIALFPDWNGVVDRHNNGSVPYEDVCELPAAGRCFLKTWNAFLDPLKGKDRATQIQEVQLYFSPDHFPYKANWEWETPLEFYFMSGDCKDYAVAKYMSLRYLGWDPQELRIVVGKVLSRRIEHAVLVVNLNGETKVLDSLHPHYVVNAENFHDFRPTYSVNEFEYWQYRAMNP